MLTTDGPDDDDVIETPIVKIKAPLIDLTDTFYTPLKAEDCDSDDEQELAALENKICVQAIIHQVTASGDKTTTALNLEFKGRGGPLSASQLRELAMSASTSQKGPMPIDYLNWKKKHEEVDGAPEVDVHPVPKRARLTEKTAASTLLGAMAKAMAKSTAKPKGRAKAAPKVAAAPPPPPPPGGGLAALADQASEALNPYDTEKVEIKIKHKIVLLFFFWKIKNKVKYKVIIDSIFDFVFDFMF